MKKRWLLYIASLAAPHIMLVVGIIMISRRAESERREIGKRIINISLAMLALGSFLYYIYFTPFFGMD